MFDRLKPFASRLSQMLRSNMVWAVVGNFSQQGLSFVIFSILARYLDPKQVGLLGISYLFTQGTRTIILDPLATPFLRRLTVDDDDSSWSFTLLTSTGLLTAGIIFSLADLVAVAFRAPDLPPVLRTMCLVIVIQSVARVYESRLTRIGAYRLMAARTVCAMVAGGCAALVLAWQDAGIWILVGQQLVYELVLLVVAIYNERRRWTPRLLWKQSRFVTDLREALHLCGGQVAAFSSSNADTALVSVFFGPTELGLYSFAKRIVSAIFLIGGASISAVGFTLFIQNQADRLQTTKILLRNLRIGLLIIATTYLTLFIVDHSIVRTIFGVKWLSALQYFPLLMLANIAQLFYLQFSSLGISVGRLSGVSKSSLLRFVLLLAISIFFTRVEHFEAIGVCWAILISTVIGSVAMVVFVWKDLRMKTSDFFRLSFPFTMLMLLAYAIKPYVTNGNQSVLPVLIAASSCFVVVGITMMLLDRVSFGKFVLGPI